MNTSPISKAIEILGSQQALADAVGVSQPAVHKWATGKASPDVLSAISIEEKTQGVVRVEALLPDAAQRIGYLRGTSKIEDAA